jgi:hypoxanthine-DNA glycosylase
MKIAFAPIIASNTRLLILGTMPGEDSLARQEYYANPHNQFWRIMQGLFDIPSTAPYSERVSALQQQRIALWDVLHSCERVGSLDSAIKNAIPNDFSGLFKVYPTITGIAFNGKKAAEWFERWVTTDTSGLEKIILPSTSPAAAMTFDKKLAAWATLQEILS